MIKRISFALASLLLIALPAVSDADPAVTAGSATVHVGDMFNIPISITGASELQSWQFSLAYNPAIVQANAVTEGPFLSESGAALTLFVPGVIDNVTGHITLVADMFVDLPPGPSGSGVLGEIEFQALALGVSPLTLSGAFLNDLDSGFGTVNGQVSVVPRDGAVPEPVTASLLSLGLGALAIRRFARRRARNKATRG
jgi:Cohesin domain